MPAARELFCRTSRSVARNMTVHARSLTSSGTPGATSNGSPPSQHINEKLASPLVGPLKGAWQPSIPPLHMQSRAASGLLAQEAETQLDSDDNHAPRLRDVSSKDLVVRRTQTPRALPPLSELKWGALYSDHMLTIPFTSGSGWAAPVIEPLGPLQLHPCAQVLHYGLECFEGMKAYRGPDGRVRLFRPDRNMARLASSCQRLHLPPFDQAEFLECIKALLREDREWVPAQEGFSLYIRPTAIATTPHLGVAPPSEALLFVVMSPGGPYFPEGLKPIKLLVDLENARAYPGGVGDKKLGGNYAPTILPQSAAALKGCSQVLYVLKDEQDGPGEEGGLVGESGAMNVFFLFRKEGARGGLELVTPPLDGLILPGVTRSSVLELVRTWGEVEVSERPLRLKELEAAGSSGRLLEMFGTGTAVVVQPISSLLLPDGREVTAPYNDEATKYWSERREGQSTPAGGEVSASLTGRVYRGLLDIQYGLVESKWSVPIDQ
eukprot:TRINITY_DN32568_c0_g1_i1.p1 TRINITY_DN32568_c0_g1~~TRINITY_DN32568_c0_g1_i1.p1  ORF type:complete len:493 (+),score=115.23 TRINITY_DN32568_c0_g1_i1:347-1825(+)